MLKHQHHFVAHAPGQNRSSFLLKVFGVYHIESFQIPHREQSIVSDHVNPLGDQVDTHRFGSFVI
jgi:hypothetical protein